VKLRHVTSNVRSASVAAILVSVVLTATLATPSALAATPKTSLTAVEADVMCVSCRESLAVAQSPQAHAERSFIRTLVAQGYNKRQIEQALVAQYGPAVLGKPPAHGFNLTVYVLPPAIVLLGIAILALTLPRWRRQAQQRRGTKSETTSLPLNPEENARLEQELAHFEG
jgi:cytochrome c-type biogenesis protein CcmH